MLAIQRILFYRQFVVLFLEIPMADRASLPEPHNDKELVETVKQLQEALAEIDSGKGLTLEEFKKLVREKHGLAV